MSQAIRGRLRQPLRRRAPTKPVSMASRRNFGGGNGLTRPSFVALIVVALIGASASIASLKAVPRSNDRVALFPKLVTGQILTYQIAYHAGKSAASKSTISSSTPQSPSGTEINLRALLRVEIVGVE